MRANWLLRHWGPAAFSMATTVAPSSAAERTAATPAMPHPTTTTSANSSDATMLSEMAGGSPSQSSPEGAAAPADVSALAACSNRASLSAVWAVSTAEAPEAPNVAVVAVAEAAIATNERRVTDGAAERCCMVFPFR